MTGLEQVYLGCFIAGLGYSVFAAFTSGMFGGHDVDVAADFDADHGFGGDGHDAGMGGDYDPDVSFSPNYCNTTFFSSFPQLPFPLGG